MNLVFWQNDRQKTKSVAKIYCLTLRGVGPYQLVLAARRRGGGGAAAARHWFHVGERRRRRQLLLRVASSLQLPGLDRADVAGHKLGVLGPSSVALGKNG